MQKYSIAIDIYQLQTVLKFAWNPWTRLFQAEPSLENHFHTNQRGLTDGPWVLLNVSF